VYFTVGGLIGVVALYLIYGIKDVIYKESRPNENHVNTILTEDADTQVQRDSTFKDSSSSSSQLNPA